MTWIGFLCLAASASVVALSSTRTSTETGEDPREALARALAGVEAHDIQPSPIGGLFEVTLGPMVAYVTEDARYVLHGDLIELETRTNLTETRRSAARARAMAAIDETEMIVFSTKDPSQRITVFTDVDCGYCRRFHAEIEELQKSGIEVRYLFYPRTGPDTESWRKAEAIWCAEDRHQALTRAKLGEEIDAEGCATEVVSRHYELGRSVRLQGTPAVVTERGRLITGYLPAKRLVEELEASANR